MVSTSLGLIPYLDLFQTLTDQLLLGFYIRSFLFLLLRYRL